MRKITKNPNLIVLSVFILLTLVKVYHLDGGFVPAEPDERNYLDIVRNFREGPLPNYDGIVLFHSPPFFHYLGFLFSFLFDGYLAIRVVSLLASLGLGVVIFFYLKSRTNLLTAAFSSSLFLVLPITVFYSRLGLIEMLISLLAFVYVVSFQIAWEKTSFKWVVVSGVALGLGLITKYSILPLLGVPVLVYGVEVLSKIIKTRSLKFLLSKEFIRQNLLLVVLGVVAAAIFVPVTFFNYSLNPFEFKTQLKQDFALGGRAFELPVVLNYLRAIPSFFTWAVTILLVLGLIRALKNWQHYLPILLSLIFLSYALLKIALYTPRYFVILVPFLLVLAGLGTSWLAELLTKKLKIRTSPAQAFVGIALVIFVLGVSPLLNAFSAGYHTTIEEVGRYVKEQNVDNQWVASNYWPSAFVDQVGYKISWYSSSLVDSASASGGGKTKYEKIDQPTFDLINKEGGWVIIEELYSQTLSKGPERHNLLNILKSKQPVRVFTDTSPNWPYYSTNSNKFSVYYLTKP